MLQKQENYHLFEININSNFEDFILLFFSQRLCPIFENFFFILRLLLHKVFHRGAVKVFALLGCAA